MTDPCHNEENAQLAVGIQFAIGALVVMLFRRLVYTLMTLYKSVSLRSDENRQMTWRELMEQIKDTLEWAQGKLLDGLRPRLRCAGCPLRCCSCRQRTRSLWVGTPT